MITRILSFSILLNIVRYYNISAEIVQEETFNLATTTVKEIVAVINILSIEDDTDIKDMHLNITQLGDKYGYPMQEHRVETKDGYVLTLFRIKNPGPPVLLMHGLLLSADEWVTTGPNHSLAYLLASNGHDVWMGNARGNKHSRRHASISPEEPRFWNFSWHEIGVFDLPAMIDYVLNETGKEQLSYIGHSQGTTSFFVMCSERPEYNQKISTMVALSPVSHIAHIKSPLPRLAAPFHKYVELIAKSLMFYEILPSPIEIGSGVIFMAVVFLLCGFDFAQVNTENLPVIASHAPAGASINQIVHYLQITSSGLFRKYDYGEKGNQEAYGSPKPPEYDMRKITAPVALFYAENDWMSDVEGVTSLKSLLPNLKDFYCIPFKMFNHMDFLWAKDVKNLVHDRLLKALE